MIEVRHIGFTPHFRKLGQIPLNYSSVQHFKVNVMWFTAHVYTAVK